MQAKGQGLSQGHESKHIQVAHRLGEHRDNAHRPIIVRCHPTLKDNILSNKTKLKGIKNSNNKSYFVTKQLPDQWQEEKCERFQQIQKAKQAAKDDNQEVDIKVKNRTVYVNKQPVKKYLAAAKPRDLFVDEQEQVKIDKIKHFHSNPASYSGSTFQAFAIKCSSITEVRRGYIKIRQLFPEAPHIIAAYKIRNGDGHQDDCEFGAGSRVLATLTENNVQNLAVYVVHQYEGSHIGPKRHKLIKQVTMEILTSAKGKTTEIK